MLLKIKIVLTSPEVNDVNINIKSATMRNENLHIPTDMNEKTYPKDKN